MKPLLSRLSDSYVAKYIAASLFYAATIFASLPLIPEGGTGASLVWPPAALGVAILWFWGLEMWPAIATGVFIALGIRGSHPLSIVNASVGYVAEAFITVYLLRHYVGFSPMMSRLKDTMGLLFAGGFATLVFATLLTSGRYLFGLSPSFNSSLWIALWMGHFVSLISFGPLLMRWLHRPIFTKTSREVVEGVAVFGSIFTLCTLLFWTPYTSVGGISLLYILIIPLIWSALRTGPRGTSLAIFLLALIGSTGILFGFGPASLNPNLPQVLFGTQMVIGVLAIIFLLFTSITEERKEAVVTLEGHVETLQGALEKISSEDQAKSDFIAILAHELRNPLSPILSGLELLKEEEKASPEVLHMMGAHLNTTARLLDDLLDISRISQKKFQLQKETVEIHDVVARCLEMVGPQMAARNHTLVTRVTDEKVHLSADPVRLAQIFVNLLNNAAKYTDPGGHITFDVRREGGALVAVVSDDGIGIAPERLGGIFEPFGGNEKGGHRPGGLRIGLSLVKRMVEMHHGEVEGTSQGVGKGSTFTVRLPLPPTMELPLPESTKRVRGRFSKQVMRETTEKLGGLRILVVDDNEAAAAGLQKLLEHHGHTVKIALDGPEGLAAAEEMRPHVAILDIGLPSMSGYDLAAAMRARLGADVTLVALTGYGQSDDKERARESGFDEHLVKPVSIADVQKVLVELRVR